MSYTIDPSNASVDFDCMTLESYTLSVLQPNNENHTVTAELSLTGGLGRINIAQMGNQFFTDDDLSAEASGLFPSLTEDQIDEMTLLLEGWRRRNVPLRFLLFSDRAVVLEDGEQFIILPAGNYSVNVGGSSD